MSTSTRSALKFLAVSLLLTFLGDRFFAMGLERLALRSQFRFAKLYARSAQTDVLILGSSRGVNGFYAPAMKEALGVGVFNLAYNGMSAEVADLLFRDYLERNPAPRQLLVEVTNIGAQDDLASELRLYRRLSERVRALDHQKYPEFAVASDFVHLLKFNNEFFLRSLYYLNRSDQNWINRRTITPELLEYARKLPPSEIRAFPASVEALGRTVRLARERGMEVTLVVSPYLLDFGSRISNLDSWLAKVREVAGSDVRVADYSRALPDTSHFADTHHLNERGSRALLARMIADGLFDGLRKSPPVEPNLARGKDTSTSQAPLRRD
jgi:hypothetical protein